MMCTDRGMNKRRISFRDRSTSLGKRGMLVGYQPNWLVGYEATDRILQKEGVEDFSASLL